MNMKFKKLGEGHRLDTPAQRHQVEGAAGGRPAPRQQPHDPVATQRAADAALARLNKTKGTACWLCGLGKKRVDTAGGNGNI